MPIYEYCCESCSTVFERYYPTFKETSKCPKCNNDANKIMSKTTFKLKGHCWEFDGYSHSESNARSMSNPDNALT